MSKLYAGRLIMNVILYSSLVLVAIMYFSCRSGVDVKLAPHPEETKKASEWRGELATWCGEGSTMVSAPYNDPAFIMTEGKVSFALVGAFCVPCRCGSIFESRGLQNTRFDGWSFSIGSECENITRDCSEGGLFFLGGKNVEELSNDVNNSIWMYE